MRPAGYVLEYLQRDATKPRIWKPVSGRTCESCDRPATTQTPFCGREKGMNNSQELRLKLV